MPTLFGQVGQGHAPRLASNDPLPPIHPCIVWIENLAILRVPALHHLMGHGEAIMLAVSLIILAHSSALVSRELGRTFGALSNLWGGWVWCGPPADRVVFHTLQFALHRRTTWYDARAAISTCFYQAQFPRDSPQPYSRSNSGLGCLCPLDTPQRRRTKDTRLLVHRSQRKKVVEKVELHGYPITPETILKSVALPLLKCYASRQLLSSLVYETMLRYELVAIRILSPRVAFGVKYTHAETLPPRSGRVDQECVTLPSDSIEW